jgi:hypothetical protein
MWSRALARVLRRLLDTAAKKRFPAGVNCTEGSVIRIVLVLIQLLGMPLPSGNDVWTVEISSIGGLTGLGAGTVAVSSAGQMWCGSPDTHCPKTFDPAALQPLIEAIPLEIKSIPTLPPLRICNDCIVRTITIRRRDAMGTTYAYTVSWDDLAPPGTVGREVIALYNSVIKLIR